MLACARIGAVHSVVFGGFSAESLRDRINDCRGGGAHHRRRRLSPRQRAAAQALRRRGDRRLSLHRARHGGAPPSRRRGRRGLRHHEGGPRSLVAPPARAGVARCPPEAMDAEDLLFILYTSGTTGKPKGIVHTTGGYLTQVAATTKYVFDLKDDDVFWCTADIGWVTGHSYVVYGPLANGATVLMYEGAPDWPERDRLLEDLRALRRDRLLHGAHRHPRLHEVGHDHPARHDLSTLRLLGTVGEPINPEAWIWYHEHIGGRTLPHRRYLVADRDRRDHDHPAPRRHHHQARLGDDSLPRHQRRAGGSTGKPLDEGRRLPHPHRAVAGHAPHHLRRRRALPGDLLEQVSRTLLRRRRRQARRGWLLVDPRPGG